MKSYFITTGLLFGVMAVVHICRAVAEWPQSGVNAGFLLGMGALILVPAALSWWAWRLLYTLPTQPGPIQETE